MLKAYLVVKQVEYLTFAKIILIISKYIEFKFLIIMIISYPQA